MYHDVVSKEDRSIDKDLLIERWVFTSQMSKQTAMSPIRFGDCFSASSSIATLCNEAFVLKVEDPVLRQIEPKVIKSYQSQILPFKKGRKNNLPILF